MSLISISGRMGSGKDTVGRIIQWLTKPEKDDEYIGFQSYDATTLERLSPFKIKKFADKLKDIVCLLIGCTREQLEDAEFKNKELGEEWFKTIWWIKSNHNNLERFYSKNEALKFLSHWKENYSQDVYIATEDVMLTPRLLLQLLGTECGRNIIHPNIWVNSLFADYVKKENIKINSSIDKIPLEFNYPNWIITDLRFPNELEAVKSRGGITIRVNRPCEECGVLGGHKMVAHKNKPSTHESEISLDESEFDYEIDNSGTVEDLIQKVKVILEKENII